MHEGDEPDALTDLRHADVRPREHLMAGVKTRGLSSRDLEYLAVNVL